MRTSTTSTATSTDKRFEKKKKSPREIVKRIVITTGVFAFWVLVWQIIYMTVGMDVIIPSPLGVAKRIFELVLTGEFWLITASSVGRILLGYLCGIVLGLILAGVTYASTFMYDLLKPVISIARATPVASMTVIIIVWVTNKAVPLFIVGLMVFPIIWANTYEGIKNTDKKLLQMADSFSAGFFSKLLYIYVPSVYPYFIAGASTALGLAWKSGVAAEILGSTQGSVGQQLNTAKVTLDSEGKFAWTVVVIVLSIIFEKAFVKLLSHTSLRFRVKAKEKSKNTKHTDGLLQAEGITKTYDDLTVLDNMSIEVKSGEVVALRGVSGAGKTTLLMILSGLLKPDKGKIKAKGGVNFLFQEDRLLPWLTVKENILFANRGADVKALLELVSLQDTEDMYPEELSGGMKRRLAIARILAGEAATVLLDEPFTGLDEDLRVQVSTRVFERLSQKAVVLVTHDSTEAKRFAQREIFIN
ncbi:MAG: ATP-binding cassette domain-containing protein [Ruminococcus sp.]|nr:ATP-binding cassette domain-containing protein [Ruminococcus sp.]